MWQKLKDQLPTILVALVLIGGLAYWLHTRTVSEMAQRQQSELAALRQQTNAEVQASAEETRRQIDAVNTLLKDAIAKRASDMFMTDEEVAQVNAERVDQLATAIAQKIQPYNPLPKTPEEAQVQENSQIDRVSSRLSERIQPILSQMASDQNLTRDSLERYSREISDQLSVVLTSELAKNQQLNNNLLETQAVAQESLALSQELAALYLSSFKDQGVLTRILTLPANVIRDASKLSIVNSNERKQKEEELMQRLTGIQTKLDQVHAAAPQR
jgi:hypothetical protein